ncbi:hypothetical protein Lal_00037739 [Lupinus albus]|nr:hypothetical protein Lal_00037739 [Lupinus albus]
MIEQVLVWILGCEEEREEIETPLKLERKKSAYSEEARWLMAMEIGENTSDAQRTIYKESKKKDCKALLLIHQCVDEANFERIAYAKTAREAWESLKENYEGAAKIKKVKLQTMRMKYELLQMEEGETDSDYFTKIHTLTNQMKAFGEEVKDQAMIEKILRTLTHKYDHIVGNRGVQRS